MESYKTILNYGCSEYEDRKSVFYGEAAPVSTEADAIAFIERVKKKYPDARHHVYAYVLRENSIMRFSDDREPQGTAGMPVLDIIRTNGCTDIVIVVTRYFGGTLLGTGGLVRAYSGAALGALEAGRVITYAVYRELSLTVNYSDCGKIAPVLEAEGFRTRDTDFSDSVVIIGTIMADLADDFAARLVEITSGRIKIDVLGQNFEF